MGFEPMASRATIWRANQLRYTHHIYKITSQPSAASYVTNVPEGIRTPDPRLRRPLLYPAELRTHKMSRFFQTDEVYCILLIIVCQHYFGFFLMIYSEAAVFQWAAE